MTIAVALSALAPPLLLAGLWLRRRRSSDTSGIERALRESEERNRALLEAIPDLMFLQDTNGVYLDYHAPDPSALLVRPADFLGRSMRDILPPELAEEFARAFDRASRSGNAEVVDYSLPIGDETRWFEARIVQSGSDKMLSVVRDFTERRRAEEARQNLAHVSRLALVGELTAMIAHEVNQPLGAILSNADAAEMLLDSTDPPLDDLRRILADIRADDLRASDVIRRVRALVRKREMDAEPLDLNETVTDALQLANADALRRGIAVQTRLAADLPAVRGDRTHLQQVLLNLLLNAMEAMAAVPHGARALTVRTARGGDGSAVVAVSDRGGGLAPEQIPRLFDSFFSTKKDGMGLGLSIARSIVEAHGGRITAENNPDGGATFQVTLSGQQPARPR